MFSVLTGKGGGTYALTLSLALLCHPLFFLSENCKILFTPEVHCNIFVTYIKIYFFFCFFQLTHWQQSCIDNRHLWNMEVNMTLAEVLVTIGISSIVTMGGTGLALHTRKTRMEAAAMHLFGMMNRSRSTAMTTARYAGVFMEKDRTTGETTFWRVVDGNSNGLRRREIEAGIDHKLGKGFTLEKDYPRVRVRRTGLAGGILSFSPAFKSSTGSVYFYTDEPAEGKIRVKLYGLSTLTRPVRVFPDGSEKPL